jgi:hypothetical protein
LDIREVGGKGQGRSLKCYPGFWLEQLRKNMFNVKIIGHLLKINSPCMADLFS